MSEERKALVSKIYQATETGDAALLDDVVTDDVIEHPLNPGQVRGREALKQLFGGLHLIVSNLHLRIEDMIVAGDRIAVRSTVSGVATGPYLGVPPAGRSMTFGAIDMWRIDGERVAEGWHVEDFVRVLIDWGALDLPARLDAEPSGTHTSTATSTGDDVDTTLVVRRWYDALRRRDVDTLTGLLHPRYANGDPHGPSLAVSPGVDGAIQDVLALHAAFPDLDVAVAEVYADGDRVVARVIVRGTHLGPLAGIGPTGRRTSVMGNEIWRLAGGRIVQHWGRFEDLDLLQQLGVVPAPGVPT
jgi:predicted ester cyclase